MQLTADTLVRAIAALPQDKPRRIVAIDGRCASGKTTLAQSLRERLACTVLHMDDFFLRPEQRTAERLSAPGGNVDHERFLAEVLSPAAAGAAEIAYQPFDCGRQTLLPARRIALGRLVIVEGSYSCHPALWELYDLRVFLTVAPDEQLRRILARNGEKGAETFRTRWIPLEERYFRAFRIESRCELCGTLE